MRLRNPRAFLVQRAAVRSCTGWVWSSRYGRPGMIRGGWSSGNDYHWIGVRVRLRRKHETG